MTAFIRHLLSTCVFIALPLVAYAQSARAVYAYINTYKHIAIDHERRFRIPASITMAQGILESGCGQSGLARKANNHFGIKAGKGWKGGIYKAWDDESHPSSFRCYASAEGSYLDHAQLLCQPRGYYTRCFMYDVRNYRAWAYMLKKCGYATAPNYAESLIAYIERYRLYELTAGGYRMPAPQMTRTPQGTQMTYKVTTREVVVYDTIYVENTPEQIEANEVFAQEDIEKEETPFWRGPRNGLWCTIIYPGETLADVAVKYNVPIQKLLVFNEVNNEQQMKTGDIVYLQKKKKRYKESQDVYYVRKGENIHDVAQTFGIRVEALAKINHITTITALHEGDKLYVK